MPFESGSVSYRWYHLPRPFPEDALEGFRERVAPALEYVKDQAVYGWVTGRHLLDRQIDEANAYLGGYLRLCLLQAERKVPASLLKAEIKQEELVRMAISGEGGVSRRERAEIKQEVMDRLLPQMPPQLKGFSFVYRPDTQVLYAETLADKQIDVFSSYIRDAVGYMPEVMDPVVAAFQSKRVDVRDLHPTSFSADVEDLRVSDNVGCDFLTWLWFRSERDADAVGNGAKGKVGLLVEGPLRLVMEGGGAHETSLRNGNPLVSSEAKACLLAGKKLSRAKLSVVKGENVWSFTFDAETFAIRSLKIPQSDQALDFVSRFSERMLMLEEITEILMALYAEFLDLRTAPETWNKVRSEMQDWTANRNVVF